MSKPALGKGLGALIPPRHAEYAVAHGATELELSRITPNENQPRKSFKDEPLKGLAASIKANGVIQPVIVRRKEGGGYELIAGERRYRAAMMAGLTKIPAVVKDAAPAETLELALIENIQREDLNPVETAEAYDRLIRDHGLTQEGMAEKVGKDRSTIANFLRLLDLPSDIKRDIAEGSLSMGHAKAVLSLDSAQKRMALRREIISRGLSVREAESLARRLKAPGRITAPKERPAQYAALEDEMKRFLGTKTKIVPKGKGGRIEIEYYSKDELDRLLEILRG